MHAEAIFQSPINRNYLSRKVFTSLTQLSHFAGAETEV